MPLSRTALAAVVLAAGPLPAFAQTQPADAPKPVTVPFTLLPSRHMVVEATVNGKGPYKFVFDTGAPLNLVTNKVAKEAGVANALGGLGMLFGTPKQSRLRTLKVGDAAAEQVPAMVMDHPTVKAISDAFKAEVGPLQGIIGFPFFARYAMTLDYQAKTLTLTPTGFTPGDYLEDMVGKLNAAAAAGSAPTVVAPAGLWGLSVDKLKGDAEPGMTVTAVAANGPAANAGLKAGDRLLTIDGRWADSVADVALAASLVKPGRAVAVVLTRDGKSLTVTVTPANGL